MGLIGQVRFDGQIALAHSDARRDLFDPTKILEGLEPRKLEDDTQRWYPHNIITISQEGLQLGNHYHPYQEVFFTPTGGFEFKLIDPATQERREYSLSRGSRILLPPFIAHRVLGKSGAVLMGFADEEFDPAKLISYNGEF